MSTALGNFVSVDTQAQELARQAAAEARRLDLPGPLQHADRLLRDLAQAACATPTR